MLSNFIPLTGSVRREVNSVLRKTQMDHTDGSRTHYNRCSISIKSTPNSRAALNGIVCFTQTVHLSLLSYSHISVLQMDVKSDPNSMNNIKLIIQIAMEQKWEMLFRCEDRRKQPYAVFVSAS